MIHPYNSISPLTFASENHFSTFCSEQRNFSCCHAHCKVYQRYTSRFPRYSIQSKWMTFNGSFTLVCCFTYINFLLFSYTRPPIGCSVPTLIKNNKKREEKTYFKDNNNNLLELSFYVCFGWYTSTSVFLCNSRTFVGCVFLFILVCISPTKVKFMAN